jgi:hypothetical protein
MPLAVPLAVMVPKKVAQGPFVGMLLSRQRVMDSGALLLVMVMLTLVWPLCSTLTPGGTLLIVIAMLSMVTNPMTLFRWRVVLLILGLFSTLQSRLVLPPPTALSPTTRTTTTPQCGVLV